LLSGCAAPLKKDVAASLISKDAKIDLAGIKNTSHCSFVVTAKTSAEGRWVLGVLVYDNDGIFIYDRDLNHLKQIFHLEYKNMNGVDLLTLGRGRQIHVLTETAVVGIQLSARSMVDQEATEKLFSEIQEHGVQKFESDGWIRSFSPMYVPVPVH